MDGAANKIPIGMHPHRGFNEVPYLKEGRWVGTDAWKPNGDYQNPMRSGSLQWGMVGKGIEHGVKFDPSYTGPVHGFQMWVNLPAAQKMDPPCFQDAEPDALPLVRLADNVQAKILIGSALGQASPIDTGNIRVQYVDLMLQAGACYAYSFPEGHTAVFVYVYKGQGQVASSHVKRNDILKVQPCGPLGLATGECEMGLLLLSGAPLNEKIVQHGPFVMASQQQIQQTFRDYQSGKFLHERCKYILHKSTGSIENYLQL